jgi:hypothetical protein
MCCNGIDSYFNYRLDARRRAYLIEIATRTEELVEL